jgi:hypothetical protein
MLCLSYYCLCLLFNEIGEKGRTGSAWKLGGVWGRGGDRVAGCYGGEMTQTMYAHVNKLILKKKKFQAVSKFL